MRLSVQEKLRMLREVTLGAPDVFAIRNDTDGRGAPWKPVYAPLTDEILHLHLAGLLEIGAYPLLPSDNELPRVWWVAADFDGKRRGSNWRHDVARATSFLLEAGATLLVNLSRSGEGAHVRVLFKQPVPAWMARRWLQAWLEEAGVVDEDLADRPTSFDRLIPPQDTLLTGLTSQGKRRPGNLIGSPCNAALAKNSGGSLVLDPLRVAAGYFAADGAHWEHVSASLDQRSWGEQELRLHLQESPGSPDIVAPAATTLQPALEGARRPLPLLDGSEWIRFTAHHCLFFQRMRAPGASYSLWVSMASQLQRFGEQGHEAWHALSALDPRYDFEVAERKWEQTANMRPVRCTTLAAQGFRCPLVGTQGCLSGAPSYFHEWAFYEPI